MSAGDPPAALRARTSRGDDDARRALRVARANASLESIARGASAAGADLERLLAAANGVGPRRVLEVGSNGGARAEALLRSSAARPITLVAIDSDVASATQAIERLRAFVPPPDREPEVHLYHATFGDPTLGAPHFTRIAPLVDLLRRAAFDVILFDARARSSAADIYLDLVQLVPFLREDAILVYESADDAAAALAAARRMTGEFGGEAVVARAAEGDPGAILIRGMCQTHTHEQTAALVDELLSGEPDLARGHAEGADEALVGLLRTWLARRLTWSTQDLLLPLGALPPPLNVGDVVERCAIWHGGVWSYGAAVTLAMLYRAFGFPATVYQFGVPGALTHMVTLVGLPDGRILVQDALLDAEPRRSGRLLTWQELIQAAAARRLDGLRYGAERPWTRPHLYSRRSLAESVARGCLEAAEASDLEQRMACAERVGAEPRAALEQAWSTSLEGLMHIASDRAALGAIASQLGTAHPLALFSHPCGAQPLSGVRAMDREIEALYAVETPEPQAQHGAMHAGA